MKTPPIYAIVPVLSSQIGHLFHYHAAVQRALLLRKWKYSPLVPKQAQISSTTAVWHNILANDDWISKKSIFSRLKILFANFFILRRFLKSLSKQSKTILFFECFDVEHFASLFLALCFVRPAIEIWILHRYVYSRFRMKTLIFRSFHWWYEKMVGKKNIRYLTDSDLLASEQQNVYGRKFSVVPIPHAQDLFHATKKSKDQLLLWWPGGSVRNEKGLVHIQRIAKSIVDYKTVRLIVADSARNLLPESLGLEFIPTELSRAEYEQWMNQADLILLPYSAVDYAHRTSGIFVEAVSMGAIPVTTQGTWMAYELEKYDLNCLAIDWNRNDLISFLLSLSSNQGVIERLKIMRADYREYHSEKNFGEVFAQIANS